MSTPARSRNRSRPISSTSARSIYRDARIDHAPHAFVRFCFFHREHRNDVPGPRQCVGEVDGEHLRSAQLETEKRDQYMLLTLLYAQYSSKSTSSFSRSALSMPNVLTNCPLRSR